MTTSSHDAPVVPFGWDKGLQGRALFLIAIAFSTYQIIVAAYHPLSSQVVRAIHVGFMLLMSFALLQNWLPRRQVPALAWPVGLLAFGLAFYHWIFEADLIVRAGDPTQLDIVVGTITLVLVFEGARRIMGPALPLICLGFFAYALFGQHLPGDFAHRGYPYSQLIEHLTFGTEGIYGTPVYVSAAYIFIFVVFAAFLEKAGMIALFNDVALGLCGAWRGGPAQVCVMSSALMGTISGSGVANVVASGQFTIPLMKRYGFRAAFAGGVEATSSMGGQIMPPVMGAVAFIMAETLDIPYAEVVKAAVIPAFLYFGACFWMVHIESGKLGLRGMDKAELPNPWDAVREHWPLVLPLAVLVYLLFAGYTPIFAGTMGLALTVVLILGMPLAALIGPLAFRLAFWVALGLAFNVLSGGAIDRSFSVSARISRTRTTWSWASTARTSAVASRARPFSSSPIFGRTVAIFSTTPVRTATSLSRASMRSACRGVVGLSAIARRTSAF